MRYTFQQLLEYQNKRNAECDQSKVDDVVDDILDSLEKQVRFRPTEKQLIFYRFTDKKGEWGYSIETLTQTERTKVLETLSDLGFRNLKFVKNGKIDTTYLQISWE